MLSYNNINFSNGIRAEEIKKCFNELDNQLVKERINVGGSGIVSGLQLAVQNFKLNVSKGELIDKKGNFISIPEKNIEIEKPLLFKTTEKKIVNANGEIELKCRPYNIDRTCASQYEPNMFKKNITIRLYYNQSKTIDVIDIKNKTLVVDASYNSYEVLVDYFYSLPRYDTVYVDSSESNSTIKIAQGTSSNSPDIIIPEQYNFIVGILKIDPYHTYSDMSLRAYLKIDKLYKQWRNLSTDENSNLVICGENYNNLEFIHTNKPEKIKDNIFWYDKSDNLLKVWIVEDKNNSEEGYWKAINDISTVNIQESKIWSSSDLKNMKDTKIFKFDKDELNLRFTPGINALTVIVDNKILLSDQYDEIIDYTSDIENSGIGFQLASPLSVDDSSCVEVRIQHNVIASPKQVFQRAATFNYTEDIIIKNNNSIIDTNHIYLTNHNQLEVFLNGKKLKNNDFIEGTDRKINDRFQKRSKQFSLNIPTSIGDVVTYKISTNVYSYSSLKTLLGESEKDFNKITEDLNEKINSQTKTLNDFMSNTNKNLLQINKYIPKGFIDFSFKKNGTEYEAKEITMNSFINLYDTNKQKALIKNIDYKIKQKENSTIIEFINDIKDGSNIYVMGIKF